MEFDANIEHLRLAFWNVVLAAGPILGIALAIGLFIGIIQAATLSMNDLLCAKTYFCAGGFALLSTFILTSLFNYFAFVFDP